MSTARAVFQAHVDDVPSAAAESSPTLLQWLLTATQSLGTDTVVTLAADTNTSLSVGTTGTLVALIPPATNAVPIRLTDVAGQQLHASQPTILCVPTGTAVTVRAVGGSIAGFRYRIF